MTYLRITREFCVKAIGSTQYIVSGSFYHVKKGRCEPILSREDDCHFDSVTTIVAKAVRPVPILHLLSNIHRNLDPRYLLKPTAAVMAEFAHQCREELRWGVSPLHVLSRYQEATYAWTYENSGSRTHADTATLVAVQSFLRWDFPNTFDIDIGDLEPRDVSGISVVG